MDFEILTRNERMLLQKNPEQGFIPAFIDWAGMKTDAPQYSLMAAALQALSLAAGDGVLLPGLFSDSPTHMNLYILIVGPSTTMRKTTVLNYVRGLLPKNQQTGQDYFVFMDDVSTQAFNKETAKAGKLEAPVLFSVDEVSGLFEVVRKKNSYLAGFDKTLMRAFDHTPVYIARTNAKIENERGAFVNVFGASTPEPLVSALDSEDVDSGLLPRFIIFDARDSVRGKRIPLTERRAKDEAWEKKRDELRAFLYAIAKDRADGIPSGETPGGEVEYPKTVLGLSEKALKRLDDIDERFSGEVREDSTGWAAIKGRAFWHIYKLAGLYALSRAGREAEVELIDVLHAAALIESNVQDLASMAQEVGSNELERMVTEVMQLIRSTKLKQLSEAVITRRLKLSGREGREFLWTLKARDLVEVVEVNGKPYWKAT